MDTKPRKDAKIEFERDIFKVISDAVFAKTIENVRKRRCINLVTNQNKIKRQKQTIIQRKVFRKFITNENEKKKLMNKSVYLRLTILEIIKVVMYEFWYE